MNVSAAAVEPSADQSSDLLAQLSVEDVAKHLLMPSPTASYLSMKQKEIPARYS